jgi:hypothetical protein
VISGGRQASPAPPSLLSYWSATCQIGRAASVNDFRHGCVRLGVAGLIRTPTGRRDRRPAGRHGGGLGGARISVHRIGRPRYWISTCPAGLPAPGRCSARAPGHSVARVESSDRDSGPPSRSTRGVTVGGETPRRAAGHEAPSSGNPPTRPAGEQSAHCARTRHGTKRGRSRQLSCGPVDDAALHASESIGDGRRDPVLDERQSGLENVEKFGDILDAGERVGGAMTSAFALKRYGETTSA